MSPAMPEPPGPRGKAGGRLWPPQPRGRRAAPHLAAARGPDAAAAAATMALSNPCPGAGAPPRSHPPARRRPEIARRQPGSRRGPGRARQEEGRARGGRGARGGRRARGGGRGRAARGGAGGLRAPSLTQRRLPPLSQRDHRRLRLSTAGVSHLGCRLESGKSGVVSNFFFFAEFTR